LLVAYTLWQTNGSILAFLSLILIGSAFGWTKKVHNYAPNSF